MSLDGNIGFSREKKVKKCRTFESTTPPEFGENEIGIKESRTGAKIKIEGSVEGFKQAKDGNYKVRICKK